MKILKTFGIFVAKHGDQTFPSKIFFSGNSQVKELPLQYSFVDDSFSGQPVVGELLDVMGGNSSASLVAQVQLGEPVYYLDPGDSEADPLTVTTIWIDVAEIEILPGNPESTPAAHSHKLELLTWQAAAPDNALKLSVRKIPLAQSRQ